ASMGGEMKKTRLVFFLSVTICGLFGCASPNASTDEAGSSVPAAKPAAARTENVGVVKAESQKPVAEKPVVTKKPEVASVAPSAAQKTETKPVDVKVANAMERNQ